MEPTVDDKAEHQVALMRLTVIGVAAFLCVHAAWIFYRG